MEGYPDRVPLQFDLCRQHIESFEGSLGVYLIMLFLKK
jgi:hypothetical protein